jgi:hypothetical protein
MFMKTKKTDKIKLLGTLVYASEEKQQEWLLKSLAGPEAEIAEEVLQSYLLGKSLPEAILENLQRG